MQKINYNPDLDRERNIWRHVRPNKQTNKQEQVNDGSRSEYCDKLTVDRKSSKPKEIVQDQQIRSRMCDVIFSEIQERKTQNCE